MTPPDFLSGLLHGAGEGGRRERQRDDDGCDAVTRAVAEDWHAGDCGAGRLDERGA